MYVWMFHPSLTPPIELVLANMLSTDIPHLTGFEMIIFSNTQFFLIVITTLIFSHVYDTQIIKMNQLIPHFSELVQLMLSYARVSIQTYMLTNTVKQINNLSFVLVNLFDSS